MVAEHLDQDDRLVMLLDEPFRKFWYNPAVESFFSSLEKERIARKVCRMRNDAKADVFT